MKRQRSDYPKEAIDQRFPRELGVIPSAWDEHVDVLVIGSGFAGLAAATEAAKAGRDTLILEKMPYYGGNSVIAGGGYCCWDSGLKLREKLGLGKDSWESHREDTLRGGNYYNDPALVDVLAQNAPAGLDWMVAAGVRFRDTVARIGGHGAYRSYQTAVSGRELMDPLRDNALDAGAQLRTESTVEWIFRKDYASPIAGVSISSKDGERAIEVRHALIIASGGYGRDVAMRTSYKPTLTADCNCTNHKGATGEMIRSAKAIGADTLHMEFIQLYPCANPQTGSVDQPAFLCFSGTGFGLIFVNAQGRRFVNELSGRDEVSSAQLVSQTLPTYSVLNAAIFERLGIEQKDVDRMIRQSRVLAGDTLEELARLMEVPADTFAETVHAHNDYLKSGVDQEFAKPVTEAMLPLEQGPFYAIAQWPSVHYCMGGIRINTLAEVIDIWGRPIPGLFAAGEVCGGVHGCDRLGGNGIAECIVFGRIAGRNAAAR
ncbi:MAG: flavocytochrome c [Coriobacteriales bacterium]|jgi:fumarate reductase flavoprotein subunit|nr:flavocytochrome c [Coriobacteriales bacterium]